MNEINVTDMINGSIRRLKLSDGYDRHDKLLIKIDKPDEVNTIDGVDNIDGGEGYTS